MSAVEMIWIAMAGGFTFMVIAEFIQSRIDNKTDAAWRAGYEQGMKVVQRNVREPDLEYNHNQCTSS